MYNIKALEEEWKRYNKKRRKPWIILGTLLVLLAAAVGVYLYDSTLYHILKTDDTNQTTVKKTHSAPTSKEAVFYIDKPLDTLAEKRQTIPEDSPMDVDVTDDVPESEKNVRQNKPRKKLHIEVIDTRKKSAYKEVEKRFRLGHDPDDSLFLAKAYYAKRQYKKAEYWALQTNKINDGIEESWLIFAKAKAKRGRRNEAKRILQNYIKRTNSTEAKVLLQKIERGRI